jgi:Tol biopolymer transport system component
MFVLPNYVLFVREQLLAQPLDMDNFEPIREPFIVADNIAEDGTAFGLSAFYASASGTLAYRAAVAQTRQWTWVNRLGNPMGTVGEPESMDPASRGAGRLSRDGRTLAFQRNYNIWLMDMIRGSLSRFTRGPWMDGRPVWSPHGDRIAFWSSRRKGGGNNDLFVKPVDDGGLEVPLLERSENLNIWDWSPDGRYILYALQRPQALDRDLWAKPVEPGADPFPIAQTDLYSEAGGRFSPDSRWIAYESDESGRYEIYVRPFPRQGRPVLVTSNGGRNPIWNPNGQEIFYVERGSRVMAVPITLPANGDVNAGTPALLFTLSPGSAVAEVSLKGDRLLLDLPLEEVRPSPITVILNWAGHRKKN